MLNNKDPPLSFKKIRLFYECINIIISETGIPGNNNSFNRDKIMKKKTVSFGTIFGAAGKNDVSPKKVRAVPMKFKKNFCSCKGLTQVV